MAIWQTLAAQKRDSIIAAIPQEWIIPSIPKVEEVKDITGGYIQQFLSPKEIEITETDAVDIIKNASTGVWSAVEVAKAFCHRAALAHQLTNCLHEIFFEAAIRDAEALDALYSQQKPLGPLHGLPVSLKDQFHVKDVETTMGYVGWIGTHEGQKNHPKHRVYESEMVGELRSLGAILYVKTAVPHTLMSGETVNNIIGYTLNPKNRYLSSGGSSGGEGALIGARGSPVGFGTDIGGSIRIPAGFNGLFGLRPSAGRLPYEGMANSMDGQNTVLSVVGPLAPSAGGLKLVVKSLLSIKPWLDDPMVVKMPWREEEGNVEGKLTFGVLRTDGVVGLQPPVRRAVEMTLKALVEAGHEVIDWNPPSHKNVNDACLQTWRYDGGADVLAAFALSSEPMSTQVQQAYGRGQQPQFDATAIAANNVRVRNIKKEYMDYWNRTAAITRTGRPVDAIICPLAPFAAARPEGYKYYGYTTWVNLLDYTSVVVPVTNVDKSVDKVDDMYVPLDGLDKEVQASYDPELYDGAHVSVQLVGRRFQEERMLAIAEITAMSLKSSK
ncbi:amidase [Tothia fuscella]|uniref:amidase n=1 Tax=Tothia fuscella TaxID=1048955 RepID=A0A9P4NQ10_9PEZI|nr:amidase [Tothia fuscella]